MAKIIVDTDELWKNLNNSLGITMGGKAPKWHWLGALKATEHTIYVEQPQGEWIEDDNHNIVCPFCGGIRRDCRIDHINFCNKCGAKMT